MEKIKFKEIKGFKEWVLEEYGYTVGIGLWYRLADDIQLYILQTYFRVKFDFAILIEGIEDSDSENTLYERNSYWNGFEEETEDDIYFDSYLEALEDGLRLATKELKL